MPEEYDYESEYSDFTVRSRNRVGQVTGVVDDIKFGKVVVVQGMQYSAFKPEQLNGANVGDKVQFIYKENMGGNGKQYLNIQQNVTVIEKGSPQAVAAAGNAAGSVQQPAEPLPPHYRIGKGYVTLTKEFPVPSDHPDRSILRQNSINVASSLVAPTLGKGANLFDAVDTTIRLGTILERHTSGEIDDQEAKKALEELSLASSK